MSTAARATIPAELRELRQWVNWNGTKKPLTPTTGFGAKANDPSTWGTLEEALSADPQHIGFEVTEPYTFVDLDHCRDPESGEVSPEAQEILDRFDTYKAVSSSGTGFQILCHGQIPPGSRTKATLFSCGVEIYSRKRFMAWTGDHYGDHADINDCQTVLEELHGQVKRAAKKAGQNGGAKLGAGDGRNNELTRRLGLAVASGVTGDALKARARDLNDFDPPLDADEVEKILRSAERWPSTFHDCSDDGNAQRIIWKHGNRVRYLPGEEKWLIWDGKRWKRDDAHEIEHLAAEALRTIHHEAGDATTETLANQLSRWATASGSAQRRSGALTCARSEPAVVVRKDDLDRDPYLLNVMNGTLDLRTGELRQHRQEDALTWLAPVEFHGLDVHDEIFEKVLREATGGDPEFQRFLQRYAGMSLVGEMTELVLILLGGTETGKSTLTGALTATLGEDNYALTGNQEALLKSANTGGPRGSVMAFEGRRLVTIPEFDPTKTLDEPLLKTLTGERTFQGRELYRNDHAMKPISKLWLHTNHMPRVSVDDASLWRRLRVAPFICRPAKIDETIKPYLTDPEQAGPAILAWMLRGCLDWQAAGGGKDGLGSCALVDGATAALRIRMDPLADFFEDCCVFELDAFTPTAAIGTRYTLWAEQNNVPKNQRKGDRVRASGLRLRGASNEGPDGYQKINGKLIRGWTNVWLDGLPSLFRSES